MSGRTVMPCTTSVPSTTQKAVKQDEVPVGEGRSRPPSGKASAAASVTMPRMPHQATTAALALCPIRSRRASAPSRA